MPGFCIDCGTRPQAAPLQVVDLDECGQSGAFETAGARAAWKFQSSSKQRYIEQTEGRVLFIEGTVDRYPRPGEPVGEWLEGRWGSYRGFEMVAGEPPRTTIFTDPWSSRPVFFVREAERLLVSDKLASIVQNAGRRLEVNWGAVLEILAIVTLYSRVTTLEEGEFLAPGEMAEFRGTELVNKRRYPIPTDPDMDPEQVRRDPAGTLTRALGKAVREVWTDPDSWLLLSGGLDSRITLALAEGKRKALTLDLYPEETAIARKLAESCGTEHVVEGFGEGHYRRLVKRAHLLTGGMTEARYAAYLGLGRQWHARGQHAIAHAFLFDSLLKGWTAFLTSRHAPYRDSVLYQMAGDRMFGFIRKTIRFTGSVPDETVAMLSAEGRERMAQQLRQMLEVIPPVVEDGVDSSLEAVLLDNISRHVYYGSVLGWMEEQDVMAPVLHPALWSWYAASRARDRFRGKALREALLALDHPVREIPDANTGQRIAPAAPQWSDAWLNRPFYPALRAAWRAWKRRTSEPPRIPLAAEFRHREGVEWIERGIEGWGPGPLLDRQAVQSAMRRYLAGEDALVEPLLAMASAGEWIRFTQCG